MVNYILYSIGEFLVLFLPVCIGYALAWILSSCQYVFSRVDRAVVKGNLQAIFPNIEKKRLKKYTKGVFISFGLYLADFFRTQKIGLAYIKKYVRLEGQEHIDQALAQGKGLILVSAHIGNWEMGAICLGLLGYPVNAVALTHKHKRVDDFFNRQRESKGVRVIPVQGAVRGCLEAFSRNQIVCLVGDRDFTQGGITAEFFGKPAMIPKGPAVFSIRNKVPIVCCFTIRQGLRGFRFFFNPIIRFVPSGEYEKDIQALTGLYLRQIEDCIRLYPGQWAMFRRFWV